MLRQNCIVQLLIPHIPGHFTVIYPQAHLLSRQSRFTLLTFPTDFRILFQDDACFQPWRHPMRSEVNESMHCSHPHRTALFFSLWAVPRQNADYLSGVRSFADLPPLEMYFACLPPRDNHTLYGI